MALVCSLGRVYSFGLGGSGQLGLKATQNVNTPQLVCGAWVTPMPPGTMMLDDDGEDQVFRNQNPLVRKIRCGGDQSFLLTSPYTVSILSLIGNYSRLEADASLKFGFVLSTLLVTGRIRTG